MYNETNKNMYREFIGNQDFGNDTDAWIVNGLLTDMFDSLPASSDEIRRMANEFVDIYKTTGSLGEALKSLKASVEPYCNYYKGENDKYVKSLYDDINEYLQDYDEPEEEDYSNNSPTGISNPADYMSNITFEKDTDDDGDMDTKVTVGKAVPGYENSHVDAGSLSGMLTDTPEVRQATINWMKGLKGKDSKALKNITTSQTFKDMYGDPDWDEDTDW